MPVWDTTAIAALCARDRRFRETSLRETPGSIESILWEPEFQELLADLVPRGRPITMDSIVQAIYLYRTSPQHEEVPAAAGQ